MLKFDFSLYLIIILFTFILNIESFSKEENKLNSKVSFNLESKNNDKDNNLRNLLEEDKVKNKNKRIKILNEIKYKEVISKFKSKFYGKNSIVFLTGAGTSTSSGIPDFRSPGGLFDQLQKKYGLIYPEMVFDIDVFKAKPEFFYDFCRNFKIDQAEPSIFHYFMGFISSKNLLKYAFTQNIDGLDSKCGMDEEKIVYAHGNFEKCHCSTCQKIFPKEEFEKHVKENTIMHCDNCGDPVKPLITFYGEPLTFDFYRKSNKIDEADLVIVCGTSLLVSPFNELVDHASRKAIRLIINREKYPSILGIRDFSYDTDGSQDILMQGDCDDAAKMILKDLDWEKDFDNFSFSSSSIN